MDPVTGLFCVRILERLDPFRTWWVLAIYAALVVTFSAATLAVEVPSRNERVIFETALGRFAIIASCVALVPAILRLILVAYSPSPSDAELSAAYENKSRSRVVRRLAALEMAQRKSSVGAEAWALKWTERARNT